MTDRDRTVLRRIGYSGATREQIAELAESDYDVDGLIAGGLVEERRIQLVETGPPMPEPAYLALTRRGANVAGLDPEMLDSLG